MMDKNMDRKNEIAKTCVQETRGNAKSTMSSRATTRRTDKVTPGGSGNKRSRRGIFSVLLSVLMAVIMLSPFALVTFADDLANTVPGDENYDTSGTVTTALPGPGGNSSHPGIDRGNSTTHQTTKVRQSQSTSSATTFASGAPLSTIYIDQARINVPGSDNPNAYIEAGGSNITYKLLASDPDFAPGIEYNAGTATVNYNPNKTSGLKQMVPGSPLIMSGPLYELTFKDAAIMPDGTKMHLKVTFSDAVIYTDERLKSTSMNPMRYDGSAYLSIGANFRYGGTDDRSLRNYSSTASGQPVYIVNETAKKYGSSFATSDSTTGGARSLALGQRMNATYQVVNDNGIPVEGSFILAFAGINIDRDPYTGGGNNTAKPLWYVNENNTELDFFSESIGINTAGLASDYIYVRSNNNDLDDTNAPQSGTNPKKARYYPIITENGGVVKVTANQDSAGSKDNASYSTGFITVADSGKGITLTGYGHGANHGSMQTSPFASTKLWYRYTASTGSYGNIQTTSEGNFEGLLSDGGTVLEPSGNWNKGLSWNGSGTPGTGEAATHVVTEGKDVYYTMTPDYGYKLGKIWIGDTWDANDNVTHYTEIKYNTKAVSRMKKGDTQQVTTAAGNNGLLTYKEDGTYVLWFDHAEHHEAVHVEWEPTTADILFSKAWYDDNDKDGMRNGADGDPAKWPKVKLQRSTNGGLTWSDVTANAYGETITALDLPSGKDTDPTSQTVGKYLDDVYTIDNDDGSGTIAHPYTWQYLPMYQYDSNGKTAGEIMYRIVEGNPTQLADPSYETSNPKNEEVLEGYKKPTFYDVQQFNLISDETKTIDGLQIYRNAAGDEFVLQSDNKYYPVTNWKVSGSAPNPQPKASDLSAVQTSDLKKIDVGGTKYQVLRNTSTNSKYRGQEYVQIGSDYYRVIYNEKSNTAVTLPTDQQERIDFTTMTNATLNGFNTADKADPYKSVAVRNEHDVSDIDVEVTKEWNDSYLWDSVNNRAVNTTTPNGNAYKRRDIELILHGTIDNGATVVDLDENDPNTKDLTITLSKDELNTRVKTAKGETVYIDTADDQGTMYVRKGSGTPTDPYLYHKVSSVDNANNTPATQGDYSATAANPQPDASDLEIAVNTKYKVDGSNYGVIFEGLQAYHNGQLIKYTVTEKFTQADSFTVTGGTITQVTYTDPNTGDVTVTGYTMSDLEAVKDNQDLKGYKANFTNTPIVEDKYEPLPVKIKKIDEYTGQPLANAQFTVYTDPAIDEKPKTSTYKQIDGLTVLKESEVEIYTDTASGDTYTVYIKDKVKYVRKPKGTDPETYDYYIYDNGTVDFTTPATDQPTDPSISYSDTGKRYVQKTDGKYYAVTGETIATTAADPQPNAAMLSKLKNTNYKKVTSDGVEYDLYTDKKGHNYILKNGEYFEVDIEGNVAAKKANPQPTATLSKVEVEGQVDEIVVVTDANGEATVTFNETGIYTIVETKAPAGYTADTDQYQFEASKELKEVKYLGPNDDHDTHWWQRLYDLIFGSRTNTKENWKKVDKRTGTLTVEDTPVTANVLVRKVWDDANDQDGVRPNTDANLPTMTLQYTLKNPTEAGESDWKTAQIYNPDKMSGDPPVEDPGMEDVDSKNTTYAGGAIHKDNNNAYTWTDLPAYRDGKVVYYRIKETGTVINDGTYTITTNKTVATGEESFNLVDKNIRATNQIVEVTNTHTPQVLDITATKRWIDNDDGQGHRPKTLKITLWKEVDNQETRVKDLTLDGNGVKLPEESEFDKDEDGTLDDTTAVYDLDGDDTPDATEKAAYDAAVAKATAELNSDAYETEKTDDNTWNAIFKDLPAFANGAPIRYRLEETLSTDDGLWYVNTYYVNYTKTNGTTVNSAGVDSLLANDIKRTFLVEDEEIKVGDDTYNVYIKNGKKYVRTGAGTDESPYVYHEIAANGSVDITKAADPQPKDPVLSKITTETTAANLRVENTSKNSVETKKYWLGGANANIRYQLYRTAITQYVNKQDASDVISRADYNELTDAQKQDYKPVVPELEQKNSTAAPIKSGETITVDNDTYDVYNHANGKKYVDKSTTDTPKWYEILGKGTTEEPYTIAAQEATIKINTWTPYDLDTNGDPQYVKKTDTSVVITKAAYDSLKNEEDPDEEDKTDYEIKPNPVWERVTAGSDRGEHLFVSSAFKTSLTWPGDDEKHVFENLHEMDTNGNPYVYRVFETTTAGAWKDDRFEGHYSDDGLTVTNINKLMEEGSAGVDVLKDLSGREWDAKYKKTGVEADKDVFYFWIEPIKGVDPDTGEIIEFTDSTEDKAAKAKVPLPGDRHQYGRALSRNTAIGTTAREVSFSPILYDATDVLDATDPTVRSREFYYKVYEAKDDKGTIVEEKDDKGITYDGTTENNIWKPKTEVLKVVASADANNVVTTEHSWEQITRNTQGAVQSIDWTEETPVFKNTYSSASEAKAWIEKNIQSREWEDYNNKKGDAFQFTITSIAGAKLNTQGTQDDSYTTMPLVKNAAGNPQKDLQQLSDSMWAFGTTGNPYTGDMLGKNGEAYFIYELTENESATSDSRDSLGLDNYTVDDLAYDSNKIYAKVKVSDNWDGTLDFDIHYYTDASCKSQYEITSHKVWIIDKILTVERYVNINDSTDIITPEAYSDLPDESKLDYKLDTAYQYVSKADPSVIKTAEEYKAMSDADKAKYTNRLKRLLTEAERTAAEAMKKAGNTAGLEAAGYREVNVAHFDNYETVDIPVKKQWIGGPAVEDVILHLERHLFPLTDEAQLDGTNGVDVVENKEKLWIPENYRNKSDYNDTKTKAEYDALSDEEKENYELSGDFWERIGYVHDVDRGEFLKTNGKPKYDLTSPGSKTSSKLIDPVEGFNNDLPKYVVKHGITYRAVYKLVEDDTSDAYTKEYDPQYYINKDSFKDSTGQATGALIVKNTVVAQNKANIAAVKQLQGRRWLTSDDFEFELTPYGVAVYDDNDNITRIDKTDAGKAKVPMPADDTGRYSKTTTTGYVSKTDATETKTETEYNALPPIAKSDYEPVSGDPTKYVNKDDPDDIISADAYNALDDGPSKLDFVAQEKSNTHAKTTTTTVDPNGNLERLARFGEITYTAEDLVYGNSGKQRLQGDFFYVMKEKLPKIVTEGDNQLYPVEYTFIKNKGKSNEKTETKAIENKALPTLAADETLKSVKFSNGITYDCDEHYVHVRVREDRTKDLSAQIAYDETGWGTSEYVPNIAKGTQFTPVYTNRYDAEGLAGETVNKYIMGRDWEKNENFTFEIRPLGSAPFFDKDGKAIGDSANVTLRVEDTTKKVQSVDLPELNFSISDLPWTVGENGAKDPRGIGTEKKVKYSDGTLVTEGTRYGRFVYAIRETAASSDTLQKDDDTEYIRLTVIDKGDGTLDTNVAVFEDRYCTVRRSDPEEEVDVDYYVNNEDPNIILTEDDYDELTAEEKAHYTKTTKRENAPATEPAFVNQLKRDLSVTKAWAGVATSDVVLKLQWSVNGNNYWDVETTDWFNVDGTRIIKKGATGDALTITWEDLPAYSNITNPNDNGNDTDLDDKWIYYQVIEEPVTGVTIRYNEKPYVQGETLNTKVDGTDVNKYQTTPFHTGEETTTMYALKTDPDTKISEKAYNELSAEEKALYEEAGTALMPVEDRVKDLYVTNFPNELEGKTRFGVVKQYIGKAWDKEEFTFVATPYESKLGDSNEFIKNGKYYKKGKKPDDMPDEDYAALDDIIYEEAYNELEPDIQGVYSEQTNNMPGASAFAGGDNTATAKKATGVDPVSVNEYPANFKDLTIKRSNLAPDGQGGMKGEFVYKIVETIPPTAVKTEEYIEDADGNKFYYYADEDENGNRIKYTTEEHFVHIVATDDGSGKIAFTVSYDDRETGQYVPVYTNYALMDTPIYGTKTWVGGKDEEHVNGTVTFDDDDFTITDATDNLGLQLQRRLAGEPESAAASINGNNKDDAGNTLAIVWVKEDVESVITGYGYSDDGQTIDEGRDPISVEEYEAITDEEEKAHYLPITEERGKRTKQETGNGTYTVKALKDGKYIDPYLNMVDEEGKEYVYTIVENDVPEHYTASYDGLDVTNTYNVKDSIKVTKTWDDAQNKSGLRPDSVTVHLYKLVDDSLTDEEKEAATENIKRENYATEEEYQADIDAAIEAAQAVKTDATDNPVQVEVAKKVIEPATGEKDEWTTGITWKDLPVYDENGDIIKYVVTEESVTGYTTTYKLRDGEYKEEGDEALIIELDDNADAETIDVKNSLTPATDEVKVEKVWDDNNNAQGKRPASVTLELYKYVYDKNTDAYDKKEKKVTTRPATAADVAAAKATDPESTMKVGDDITVPDLVLDGEADTENLVNYEEAAWKGIWKNLPRTENGKTVLYIVKEVTTDGGVYADPGTKGKYTKKPCISGDQINGYKVTNTYTPDTTTAKVTKTWADNQNALNSRPSKLTMTLMRKYEGADGQPVHEVAKDINGGNIKDKISADDEDDEDPDAETWVYEVKDLPRYTKVVVDGSDVSREYTYYWKETVPAGYTATVPSGSDTSGAAAETGKQTVDNNKTITNTYITGTLTVRKTWNDAKNSDGVRPSADEFLNKVTLYAGNTKITDFGNAPKVKREIAPSSGTTGSGTNQNIYTITYSNLPVLDKTGTPISYSISEDAIPDYSIEVAPLATTLTNTVAQGEPAVYTGSINLTNKHDYETTDIEITKNWYDRTGFKHEKAETFKNRLELYADGTKVTDTALLNTLQMTPASDGETADKFIAKWTGLPKYKIENNKLVEIVYTVKENGTVKGYAEPKYNNKASLGTNKDQKAETDKAYNGGEINNIQLITVDVEKTWDDNSDHDNQRPEEIKIKFFRNGIPLTTEFGGPEVTLKKDETKNGGTFTDNNNIYKWTKVLINLPYADENGTPYNYTAVETEAKKGDHWYSAFVGGETMRQILLEDWNDDKNILTYKLTNKDDDDKVSFAVDKIWNDSSDVDRLRPETITYKLYQQPNGGTKTQVTSLPADDCIKYTNGTVITMANNGDIVVNTNKTDTTQGTLGRIVISGLPKYAAGGKEITYTIVEDAVPGYNLNNGTAQIVEGVGNQSTGITVTNVHTRVSTSVTPQAIKAITGRNFKLGGETFRFLIEPQDGAPRPAKDYATVTAGSADGKSKIFDLPEFTFTGADMADTLVAGSTKTFTYKLTEVNGGKTIDDLKYDDSELTLNITVTRKADGGLEIKEDDLTTTDVNESGVVWGTNNTDAERTFTNEHGATKKLTLRKVWVDDDADSTVIGTRPAKVTFTLTANITSADGVWAQDSENKLLTAGFTKDTSDNKKYTKTYVLKTSDATSEEDIWQIETGDLPKYDAAGEEITYSVSESEAPLPNYKAPTVIQKNDIFTVTNEYDRVRFTGTKKWIDGGKKHDNVTELEDKLTVQRTTKADPVASDWTDVTGAHIHWNKATSTKPYTQSFTITGIPEKDEEGNKYIYRVVESRVGGDYVTTYTNTNSDATEFDESVNDAIYNGGTVTNKLDKKIELTGEKKWINGDDNDHDNTKLAFELWRTSPSVPNGEKVETIKVDGENQAVTAGGWTKEKDDSTFSFGYDDATDGFTGGKLFDKYDAEGNEYTYEIKNETGYPQGYSPSYDGMTVTNELDPTTVTVKPEFTKKTAGMPQEIIKVGGETFTFALLPQTNHGANGAQKPDTLNKQVTVLNNDDGTTFDFGEITFDAAGEYKYKLIESAKDGWTTDRQVTEFTIEVTDTNGVLSAEIKWPQGATVEDDKLVITNTYAPKAVPSSVDLKKELTGRTLKAEEFNFTMTGLSDEDAGAGYKDATGKDAAGTNKADGTVKMSEVSFTEVGKYAFEVTEDVPTTKEPGMTYASTKYKVEAVVTGASDGTLSVAWNILEKDGAATQDSVMTFTNTYDNLKVEEDIYLKKVLEGRVLKANEFEFVLAGDDTASTGNQAQQTVKNTAGGALNANKKSTSEAFKFTNKIPFTLEDLCDHDGSYIDHDKDGTYSREFTYKVFEKPGDVKGVTYDGTVHELKATLKYIPYQPAVEDNQETQDVDESKPAVDAHLEVTWKLDGADIDFKKAQPETVDFANTYVPNSVSGAFTDVDKLLSVPAGQSRSMLKDEFLFEMLDAAGNRVALGTNGTAAVVSGDNDSRADVTFAPITFTKDMVTWTDATDTDGSITGTEGAKYRKGELTYTIKEIAGNNKDDLRYDGTTKTVKAVLIDEGTGSLQVKWEKVGSNADYVFTNEVPAETVDKPVRVTWVNDTDYDDTVGDQGTPESTSKDRPAKVTVTLQASSDGTTWKDVADPANQNKSWSVTLDENSAKDEDPDNWFSDAFKDLPKYDADGNEITYRVVQTGYELADGTKKSGEKTDGLTASVIPASYTTASFQGQVTGLLDTIVNTFEITNIVVAKTWVDPAPGKHNNSAELKLKVERSADGSTWKTLEDGKDYHIDWSESDSKATIRGLTKYVDSDADPKVEYTYRVTENAVEGYSTTYKKTGETTEAASLDAKGGEIINKIDQDYVTVKVTKKWVGKATDDVTFKLKSNAASGDGVVATHVFKKGAFDSADTAEFTFSKTEAENAGADKLPKYDLDPQSDNYGKEIVYTVEEDPAGNDNFTAGETTGSMKDGFTITNTNKETVTIYAQKQWDKDGDAKDGRGNVQFKLIQTIDGASKAVADYETTVGGQTKTITGTQTITANKAVAVKTDAGTISWPNLPKFDKNGNEITYTVEELAASIPAGYTQGEVSGEGTEDKPYVIINTLGTDTIDIPVRKVWDDNKDQEGKRPENSKAVIRLMAGDERAKIDGENVDDLVLNDDNNRKDVFKDLPKTDANGAVIQYSVVELDADGDTPKKNGDTVFDVYTVAITGSASNGFTVRNSYTPGKVSVTVTKKWAGDDEVSDQTRKTAVFHLIGRTGEGIAYDGGEKKIKVGNTSVTWTGLPKSLDGTELTWQVYEDVIPGYTTSIEQTEGTDGKTTDGTAAFQVTNTYNRNINEVSAIKIWQDGNDRDGKRDDVYFRLYRKVGADGTEEAVPDSIVKVDKNTAAKDGEDAGSATWKNLPEVISEANGEPETSYQEVSPGADDDPSEKGWFEYDEAGDTYNASEDEAVVAGKTYYEEISVEYTVDKAVIYWVKEVDKDGNEKAPDGYDSVVTQTAPGEFEVTNIRTPDTTDISVQKIWNDENDEDGLRPDHIKILLKAGGDTVGRTTITSKDEGSGWNSGVYTFENMPKNENGEPIVYSVVELDADESTELDGGSGKDTTSYGYTVSITGEGTDAKPFVITNTLASGGTCTLTVTKKWAGDANHKDTRGDVKFRLIQLNGKSREDMEMDKTVKFDASNPDGAMTATWTGLPIRVKGKPVTYTVEEYEVPQGYQVAVGEVTTDGNNDMKVTVTNTYNEVKPNGEDVIYVDPMNPKGKMVVKSTRYNTHNLAKTAAEKQTDKPADPSHKNVKFAGWVVNYDENGNYVMVATYSQIPTKVTPTVSYIDPMSGKPVIISKQTADASSIKAPADPKHKNLQFTGWIKTTDANGNVIFVAGYSPDCGNGVSPNEDDPYRDDPYESGKKDPHHRGYKSSYVDSNGKIVRTGEESNLFLWMAIFITSILIIVSMYAWKRREKSL